MTFLGTIVAASATSVNNRETAAAFNIDGFWPRLLLVTPSASGVTFRVAISAYNSLSNASPTFVAGSGDFGLAEQTIATPRVVSMILHFMMLPIVMWRPSEP